MTFTPANLTVRDRPDWDYRPQRHQPKILKKRARLVSVYNHEDCVRSGRNPLDFNPTLIDPDEPRKRGRYHSTAAGPFAYKYLAHLGPRDDERLSIWEVLTFHDVGLSDKGRLLVPASTIAPYAFLDVRPTRDIHLVQLHNQSDGLHFLASMRALRGEDFSITREWARYIRDTVRAAEGISFVSSAFGDSVGGGYAVVLFEDLPHVTDSNAVRSRMLRPIRRKIARMADGVGKRRFERALRDIGVTVI